MEISDQLNEQAEPFVQATIDTFKTMLHLDIRRGGIHLRKSLELHHDVSGMIGLTGEAEGSVSLGFSKPIALALAGNIIGDRHVSEVLMADSVGELVNIITGFAGKDMKQRIRISLPTIVLGHDHVLTTRRNDLQTVTSFESPLGAFHLYVYLEDSVQA
jgi:chemotaxis protein CheX